MNRGRLPVGSEAHAEGRAKDDRDPTADLTVEIETQTEAEAEAGIEFDLEPV